MGNVENKTCLAVGFVCYYPDNNFFSRVQMLAECGFQVYIHDNSPETGEINTLQSRMIKYYTSGHNVGLGVGLYTITSNCYQDGFKYLIFFDQDSIFSINTIKYVTRFINENINFLNSYTAISFNSKRNCTEDSFQIVPKKLVISSASLFVLENCKKINWHNRNFFVDNVDYEFCLRSIRNNFLIGESFCAPPDFDHISGQVDKKYTVFGKTVFLRAYPAFRIYDSIRSYFKLLLDTLFNLEVQNTYLIIRSFLIFCYFQILVRVIIFFNKVKF